MPFVNKVWIHTSKNKEYIYILTRTRREEAVCARTYLNMHTFTWAVEFIKYVHIPKFIVVCVHTCTIVFIRKYVHIPIGNLLGSMSAYLFKCFYIRTSRQSSEWSIQS